MAELLHSRGMNCHELYPWNLHPHLLSLRCGRTRKLQLPIKGGGLTLVVQGHSRAAAEVDCAVGNWSWSCWQVVSGMVFCTEELPGEIACEFQCYMLGKGRSCRGYLDLSCAVLHTGPYFACYSSSLKCSVIIVPDENAFLSWLCGEAEPIF